MGKVGIWMYQNGGGDVIEQKLVNHLRDLGHEVTTNLNLRYSVAKNGAIYCGETNMYELDAFLVIMLVNKLNTKYICMNKLINMFNV